MDSHEYAAHMHEPVYVLVTVDDSTAVDSKEVETDSVEADVIRIAGMWAMVGVGAILNGCATLAAHDSDLAIIARVTGILSTTSVFVYTVWKLVRLWQKTHHEHVEDHDDE